MQHTGVAPAARTSGPSVREAVEEGAQPHLSFGAGQGRSQAEVPTAGEGEVPPCIGAFDVEAVRIGEHGWVTVGGSKVHDH